MALNYTALNSLAFRLISENGSAWTLERKTVDPYDPASLGKPVTSTASFTIYAVVLNFSLDQVDGQNVLPDDRMMLVTSDELTITPQPDDKVIKDSEEWRVINVREIKPADQEIYWEFQIRR